jgi:Protein of unknown function (DUF4058)
MPLHDWSALTGWDGVHHLWISELLYAIKPLLPAGYRAYVGTTPTFAIGGPGDDRPDVGVRDWPPAPPTETSSPTPLTDEPDEEIAVAALVRDTALLVERQGRLVAAIELVSLRNKDRESARDTYASAYVGYLLRGVHLLLVDVHRRPLGFSFADRVGTELGLTRPSLPSPFAVAYRVGEPAPSGGSLLATWRRSFAVGKQLPTLPLPLSVGESVSVDLDRTYRRAAEAAYLG